VKKKKSGELKGNREENKAERLNTQLAVEEMVTPVSS